MAIAPCTAVGCYLSQSGGLITFPAVTIAGLIDGINPCAIGILLTLLGGLIVFAKRKDAVWKIGLVYIATVYLTYFFLGLFFYNFLAFTDRMLVRSVVNRILGALFIGYGLLKIKEFVNKKESSTGTRVEKILQILTQKANVLTTILLAVFVTLIETPCSLPLYVGTARILSVSDLPKYLVYLYFAYYNLLFVAPLIVVLILAGRGRDLMMVREAQHALKKWMKVVTGTVLIVLGIWMLN